MEERMKDNEFEPVVSERGFKQYPPIEGTYNDQIRVYESSAATGPHLWVNVLQNGSESTVHLDFDACVALRDTLDIAMRNHYQLRDDS